jgi:hypothetical protein
MKTRPRPRGKPNHADRRSNEDAAENETQLREIIEAIIVDCGSPARVLELYYWSQESDLWEMIRSLMNLPPPVRTTLSAFLMMATDRDQVSARIGQYGELTLFSGHVADALAIVRAAVDGDESQRSRS